MMVPKFYYYRAWLFAAWLGVNLFMFVVAWLVSVK